MSQRAPSRATLVSLAGMILAVAAASSSSSARAAARPDVSVGEVSIAADTGAQGDNAAQLGRVVRAAINEELSRVSDWRPMKRPLIMSATLTRLSSERREERSQASATISLALRRADDQVLLAELRGRASVQETSGNLGALRRAALRGAIRTALERLPEACGARPNE